MVVTRELLKAEIDRMDDRHLKELYRMLRFLEAPKQGDRIHYRTLFMEVN